MEYRKFGRRYMVRVDRGEDIVKKILELCEKEEIHLAAVEGIAAADHVVLARYDLAKKEYSYRTFDEALEVSSITGNITTEGRKICQHLHATVCDAEFRAFGGHLEECRVSGAAELFLTVPEGSAGRRIDEETGIHILDFSGRYIEL